MGRIGGFSGSGKSMRAGATGRLSHPPRRQPWKFRMVAIGPSTRYVKGAHRLESLFAMLMSSRSDTKMRLFDAHIEATYDAAVWTFTFWAGPKKLSGQVLVDAVVLARKWRAGKRAAEAKRLARLDADLAAISSGAL